MTGEQNDLAYLDAQSLMTGERSPMKLTWRAKSQSHLEDFEHTQDFFHPTGILLFNFDILYNFYYFLNYFLL